MHKILALLQMLLCYSVTGDERCHINLFNDYTASIYVNGKCKHKHVRPFLKIFRDTSQFCRLTDFLVQLHQLVHQDLSLTLKEVMAGCDQINK